MLFNSIHKYRNTYNHYKVCQPQKLPTTNCEGSGHKKSKVEKHLETPFKVLRMRKLKPNFPKPSSTYCIPQAVIMYG